MKAVRGLSREAVRIIDTPISTSPNRRAFFGGTLPDGMGLHAVLSILESISRSK
jgi:hypothetical protein